MKSLKSTLSASILSCAMSAPAMADIYTPTYLHYLATQANIITQRDALVEIASIAGGMLSAVLTLQDLGIVPRYVCPPIKDGKPDNFKVSFDLYKTIRVLSPSTFPDTDQGGAVFMYAVMMVAHPCK